METDPVEQLRSRVADAGLTMKDVCREAGVAESTPSRWSLWAPKVATLNKMHQALDRLVSGSETVFAEPRP